MTACKLIPAAMLIAALGATAAAKMPKASDETAVRETFEAYTKALADGDGDRALELVDRATVAHNQKLLRHALKSDKQALSELPIVDRFTVLRARLELPPAKLREMKGADLVRHSVEQGWAKAWKLDQASVEAVVVDGDRATVEVSGGRLGKSVPWKLLREGDSWRVSVVSVLPKAEALLQTMRKRFGKSEDELVLLALRMLTGKDAEPTIWDPPG